MVVQRGPYINVSAILAASSTTIFGLYVNRRAEIAVHIIVAPVEIISEGRVLSLPVIHIKTLRRIQAGENANENFTTLCSESYMIISKIH